MRALPKTRAPIELFRSLVRKKPALTRWFVSRITHRSLADGPRIGFERVVVGEPPVDGN